MGCPYSVYSPKITYCPLLLRYSTMHSLHAMHITHSLWLGWKSLIFLSFLHVVSGLTHGRPTVVACSYLLYTITYHKTMNESILVCPMNVKGSIYHLLPLLNYYT